MIVKTHNLTKSYKRFEKEAGLSGSIKSLFQRKFVEKVAVNKFDLTIQEGEFVGLIGANGAGKTTLMKMLTGIIAPTSGEISVLGYYPNKLAHGFKKQYAIVMGQKSQLFFELTPMDTFHLFKELYSIPDAVYHNNIDYFVSLFQVKEFINVQVRTLSLGERMKMELIVALLHNPQILFLDEPTIGLDAISARQIRTFLKEVNKNNHTTIILTSHYMEDVRSLCPRSIVVNGGKKIYDGNTDFLFESYQTHKKITVQFEEETQLVPLEGVTILEHHSQKSVFMVEKEKSGQILSYLTQNYTLSDILVEEEDIGSVVEKIYAEGGHL